MTIMTTTSLTKSSVILSTCPRVNADRFMRICESAFYSPGNHRFYRALSTLLWAGLDNIDMVESGLEMMYAFRTMVEETERKSASWPEQLGVVRAVLATLRYQHSLLMNEKFGRGCVIAALPTALIEVMKELPGDYRNGRLIYRAMGLDDSKI